MSSSVPSVPHLFYFAGRGLAETIRLIFAFADQPLEETYVRARQDFLQLLESGKLPYNQIPVLDIDGKTLCQSKAIVYYLTRKFGFYPTDPADQYVVDMLHEGKPTNLGPILFRLYETEEARQAVYREYLETKAPVELARLQKVLDRNPLKSGFFVGSSLTHGDIVVFELLQTLVDMNSGSDSYLEPYPGLLALYRRLAAVPSVAGYLTSSRRHPLPNATYLAEVNASLDRK